MNKKPDSKTAAPPTVDEVKAKPSAPVQFGPTASAPGSRLKKR